MTDFIEPVFRQARAAVQRLDRENGDLRADNTILRARIAELEGWNQELVDDLRERIDSGGYSAGEEGAFKYVLEFITPASSRSTPSPP